MESYLLYAYITDASSGGDHNNKKFQSNYLILKKSFSGATKMHLES